MKRYYNQDIDKWYYEGTSINILYGGALYCGILNEEMLGSLGYVEYVEPEPTEEELLQRARESKLLELDAYDSSPNVNSFSVGGVEMWLDAATRQQLRISLDACQQAGRETVEKWFNGVRYEFPTTTWYQMLIAVEVYASDALNVTDAHRAAIEALGSIADIEEYDFTVGYPDKLSF